MGEKEKKRKLKLIFKSIKIETYPVMHLKCLFDWCLQSLFLDADKEFFGCFHSIDNRILIPEIIKVVRA